MNLVGSTSESFPLAGFSFSCVEPLSSFTAALVPIVNKSEEVDVLCLSAFEDNILRSSLVYVPVLTSYDPANER